MRGASVVFLVLAACVVPAAAQADPWALPEPGSCNPKGGLLTPGRAPDDATPVPFKTGDTFAMDRLNVLENYLPAFLWQERERFFFEGMRLEIGPCFRDYSPPAFFRDATQRGAGKAKL